MPLMMRLKPGAIERPQVCNARQQRVSRPLTREVTQQRIQLSATFPSITRLVRGFPKQPPPRCLAITTQIRRKLYVPQLGEHRSHHPPHAIRIWDAAPPSLRASGYGNFVGPANTDRPHLQLFPVGSCLATLSYGIHKVYALANGHMLSPDDLAASHSASRHSRLAPCHRQVILGRGLALSACDHSILDANDAMWGRGFEVLGGYKGPVQAE